MDDGSSTNDPTVRLESTSTLLSRVREGDDKARERLLARFLAPLRRWAHGRIPARARGLFDTDDLVQITLLRSLDHLKGFDPRREGAFLAYLRRILVNQIRDEIRKADRGPRREELGDEVRDPGPSPVEEILGRETVERYEAALARLPAEHQEAVVLRIELGFSYPEIAEALASPSANAARMTVVRALVRLGEELT